MTSLLDRLWQLIPKGGLWKNPLAQRIALGIGIILLSAIPLVIQAPPIGLTEGAPAPRTFRANRTVQFEDEAATEEARKEAAESVEPVVVFDQTAVSDARGDVNAFFDFAIEAKEEHSNVATAVAAALAEEFPDYDETWFTTVSTMDPDEIRQARRSAEQLATTVLTARFTADEMSDAVEQMREAAANLPYPAEVREMIAGVVESSMRPTLKLDPAATEAARESAAEAVEPVVISKQAGENIVQKGEIVTAQQMEIIRRLGLLEQSGSLGSFTAMVFLLAFTVTSAGAYVWRFDSEVWDSLRYLVILGSLFVGMVWSTRIVLWLWPEIPMYALPVPLAAMLATLLISAREGMLIAILTSLAAVLLGFSGGAAVVAMLVWSIAAVTAMSFMTDRRALFYVGAFLVTLGAVIGVTASLAAGLPFNDALVTGMWGAVGGVISAVLGYGLLPFFEHIFGVTTDVRLLELGNPGHPLLKELMLKAPGTYSHSVLTANLAEAAAEQIGANPVLARVGAYYHDIGKIRRPGFFVENQAGEENPHDSTTPTLSALIITSHVRDGVELAEKYRLPPEIIDIIRQHHGTSLVRYFYDKAAEGEGPVFEADFRYDGERPQSREAALVMLADTAEAAVRTVKKPTLPRIEAVVRRVVDEKVDDGQLDDADLTLADIEQVIKIYSKMLASVYHTRVEYPKSPPRRSANNASKHHDASRS